MNLKDLREIGERRTKDWETGEGSRIDVGYCHFRFATGPWINYMASEKLGTPAYSEDRKLYDSQVKADRDFIATAAQHWEALLSVVEAAKSHADATVQYRLGRISEVEMAGYYNKLMGALQRLEKVI